LSTKKVETQKGLLLDSLISGGCIINGGVIQRCILSPNVRIDSYAEVYDSILMGGVNVSEYVKIKRAIIDKDVNIPQKMVIGYDLAEDKKKQAKTKTRKRPRNCHSPFNTWFIWNLLNL
jgi:glucose-1-phosphate adenylyltransferase